MNNKNPLLENLYEELNKIKPEDILSYNGIELILSTKNNSNLNRSLISVFNSVDTLPGDKVEVKLSTSKYKNVFFYLDETDFLNRSKIDLGTFESSHIFFINPQGKPGAKEVTSEDTFSFAENVISYREILNFFVDYKEFSHFHNDTSKTFTIISKEYGIFQVGYILPKYEFFYSLNLHGKLERLKNDFQKKEFIQFFKEVVVTSIHSTGERERFQTLLKQLDSIIDLASKDYEAYVSNFAIDKIKSEFREEREIYFQNIDRSINSIGKQVVSFPLTFAASIFASYKVQDKPGVILLILVAYFLYSAIAILILRMTSYNVSCLKSDVLTEEKEIKTAYGKIYSDFKDDFFKIKHKLFNLRIIINLLYVVLGILFILFSLYAGHTMEWINLSDLVEA